MKEPAIRRATTSTAIRRPAGVLLMCAVLLAGCGSGTPSPRPSAPSSAAPTTRLNPPPTSVTPPRTPAPSVPPQAPDWPPGWDTAFCAAFSEVVIAQELVVDVGRALAEENRPDALGLATWLIATAEVAAQRLGSVSGWEPADALVNRLTSLMDIGVRVGRQYRRYLADDEPAGLGRANELITEMRPVVDETTARLSDLAREGLSCPGHELTIESP